MINPSLGTADAADLVTRSNSCDVRHDSLRHSKQGPTALPTFT